MTSTAKLSDRLQSLPDAPLRAVTEDEIETFERDGVVLLKQVFPQDWLDAVGEAIDANMAAPGPLVLEYAENTEGRYHGDMFMWTWNDVFRAYVFDSPAKALAANLMRTEKVNFFYDHLLVKEPGTNVPTPWHHDLPYWPLKGSQICSLWMPLDEAGVETGGMQYILGSHRWGKMFQAQSFTGDDRYAASELEPIPDIDGHRDDYDICCFETEPGDVLAHHALTVHGSPGNTSQTRRRRALASRWTGDDARYDPRPGTFKLIRDPELEADASLDSDLFPVVWRRSA